VAANLTGVCGPDAVLYQATNAIGQDIEEREIATERPQEHGEEESCRSWWRQFFGLE
jgi:hypothetical protein